MLSYEALCAAVRREGIEAGATPPTLPATAAQQWALLAPYVGKPLREIPKALVLLFTARDNIAEMVSGAVRALPPAARQVHPVEEEAMFL